jgi:hypothetical protein
MRVSNHPERRTAVVLAIVAALGVACGGNTAPSIAAATAVPTPQVTPDPHLTEPATADQVFNALRLGHLPMSVNNATSGDPNSPMVKRINAALDNWPLVITEYRTSAQLRSVTKWDPTAPPGQGNPPYAFVGMNVLIEFGPVTGLLATPDSTRQKQAMDIIALIDPLLWPLEQRAVVPIPTKTATPISTPSPAASASAAP